MKVFISWSGEKSKKIAKLIHEYLPVFFQASEPFLSQSIEKGTNWLEKILNNLEESYVGIVCLTKENQTSTWINFEAGSLYKGKNSRIMTLLLDLKSNEVISPLNMFMNSTFEKKEFFSVIKSINDLTEKKVNEKTLEIGFNANWLKFYNKAKKILEEESLDEIQEEVSNDFNELDDEDDESESDYYEELLYLARDSNNLLKSIKTSFITGYPYTSPSLAIEEPYRVSSGINAVNYHTAPITAGIIPTVRASFLPNDENEEDYDENEE